MRETLLGIDIIVRGQPETVLVKPRTPLGVRIAPRGGEIDGRDDEIHRPTVTLPSGNSRRIVQRQSCLSDTEFE